jgi:hypothetical protein
MARPTPRGNSRLRTYRLGARADAQTDRLAEELGLNRHDVTRSALDALERDEDFRFELAATRRAQYHLDRWRQTFGARGVRLFLRRGKPVSVREGHIEREIADTIVETHRVEGRRQFDIRIAGVCGEPDVILAAVFVASDADVTECALPLDAVHLAGPVPPIEGEVVSDGPNGVERTIWRDGTRLTFVGESVAPSRVARFA